MICNRCCHYYEIIKQYGAQQLCAKCIRMIERGSGTYILVKDESNFYEENEVFEQTDLQNLTR